MAKKKISANLCVELFETCADFNKTVIKEFQSLTKELTKLKEQLKKATLKQRTTKNKRVEIQKKLNKKSTASLEKQLDKAFDAYEDACEAVLYLKEDLEIVKTEVALKKEEMTKLVAIQKMFTQFEKTWARNLASVKKKKRKKTVKAKTKETNTPAETSKPVQTEKPTEEILSLLNLEMRDTLSTPETQEASEEEFEMEFV